MSAPTVYLHLPGTAREALTYYHEVFGGDLQVFTNAEFNRDGLPPEQIAHGQLGGEVSLCAADAGPEDQILDVKGLLLSLLGTDEPTLRGWYQKLAAEGTEIDPLQRRPWGDFDGIVQDRYGLRWLIGFKGDAAVRASSEDAQ